MKRQTAAFATLLGSLLSLTACDSVNAKSAPSAGHAPTEAAKAAAAEPKPSPPKAEQPTSTDKTALHATRSRCVEVCSRSDALGCSGQASCATSCEEMRAASATCIGHVDAFLACLSARAPGDFECGDEGLPSVKEGHCEGEQATLAHCLMGSL